MIRPGKFVRRMNDAREKIRLRAADFITDGDGAHCVLYNSNDRNV